MATGVSFGASSIPVIQSSSGKAAAAVVVEVVAAGVFEMAFAVSFSIFFDDRLEVPLLPLCFFFPSDFLFGCAFSDPFVSLLFLSKSKVKCKPEEKGDEVNRMLSRLVFSIFSL